MRTLILVLSFILTINLKVYTQTDDTSNIMADWFPEMPIFPGGPDSLWCFLESNFTYDILNADQKMISYFITFFVDSSGNGSDFGFISTFPRYVNNDHADSLKRAEILRVFALMPKWEPAKEYDKRFRRVVIAIKTPYTEFRCKKKNING